MNKVAELSIFFPFWNEEKNIKNVVRKAIPVADKVADKWEMILIDDGSSDKTLELANNLAIKDQRLRVIAHKKNRGYGASLKTGLEAAKYNLIVFNDGDGQFDFSQINKFLEKVEEADLVIGFRKKRLDNRFRHILMALLKLWDFIFFGFKFKDIDCGFKLFKRSTLGKILPLDSEGAMITTEILAKAKRANFKISEIEVSHFPRIYGDQSGGNLRVILRAIKESFSLWANLNLKYGRN
jgi:glycosyltransferase involved in cell wall biosynthesis